MMGVSVAASFTAAMADQPFPSARAVTAVPDVGWPKSSGATSDDKALCLGSSATVYETAFARQE